MEKLLDRSRAALDRLNDALDGYTAAREGIRRLEAYYTGEDWRRDFEDDEEGRLPADLKRGVLSQDGIWNMLERNRELLQKIGISEMPEQDNDE